MKLTKNTQAPNKVEQLLNNTLTIEMTEAQALIIGALLARSGDDTTVRHIQNIIDAWNLEGLKQLTHVDVKMLVQESLKSYASDIRSPFDNYFRNV